VSHDPFAVLQRARAARASHNLPYQLTSIVGRESELSTAAGLLLNDAVRLLTFTGPGGAGKTRMSIELGWRLVDKFPGGVFLVSLGIIGDPQLVVPEIANTLRIVEKKEQLLIQSLKEVLRENKTLIILDGFEHLLTEAPVVAELLSECPKIKIVVTSQAPLRIRGEYEFPLLPLPLTVPVLFALLGLTALFGGIVLIPCEGFVQTRPAADRKGAVIAAVNFLAFSGMFLSCGLALLLDLVVRPSTAFAVAGLLALPMGLWVRHALVCEEPR
jgi:hypothetical protein